MKHDAVKQLLFQDEEIKNEYDALSPVYDMEKELIRLRLEQGISQHDLAELIDTKQSTISRLENGS